MFWSDFSARLEEMMAIGLTCATSGYLNETAGLVRELVRRKRDTGMKQALAIEAAARELGLSPRRVRAYWYDEVTGVLVDEYFDVRARFAQHLCREAARLRAESALLDRRQAAFEGRA